MRRRDLLFMLAASAVGTRGGLSRAFATEDELAAVGLRRLASLHLELITDLPSAPAVDELPQVFEQALPQWCRYFGIAESRVADWRVTACLMRDPERFRGAELLPADLPQFLHGYQRGARCWLYEQPSDYYRRLLMLHEGTHAFMREQLGGAGPPWYMEGMAEYLATHRWQDARLQLAQVPANRDEAAYWGRIKVLRDQCAEGRLLSLLEIMKYDARAHLRVEPYAWCWAAVTFFDHHPQYREAFRECQREVRDSSLDFSRRLYQRLKSNWRAVELAWYAFLAEVDYGSEVAAMLLEWAAEAADPVEQQSVTVAANRGWQDTGLQLAAGAAYALNATGRFAIHQQPRTWWSEPQGVTLRYHAGKPLGQLVAAVMPDAAPPARIAAAVLNPESIGASAVLRPQETGRLLLKLNDSPAELTENEGAVTVHVLRQR